MVLKTLDRRPTRAKPELQMANTAKAELRLIARTRPRVLRGHPWVYANEVQQALPREFDGQGVALRDARGRFLGVGVYNSKSQICWRRFSRDRDDVDFNADYLKPAIEAAYAHRERMAPGRFRRLVWSDADFIPGLIVDQFDDILVIQAVTIAVDRRLSEITEILQDILSPAEIVFRNDAPVRKLEGLREEVTTLSGNRLPAQWFQIDGIEYFLDLERSQKTGYYLDQRPQHLKVARLAAGRRVIDGFCNQGSFALQCARAGAASVKAVDSSEECIKLVKLNAGKNQLKVDAIEANVFDLLSGAKKHDTYDLIILDPPSFARNRKALNGAIRGYKELNLRAMQLLSPGGILATYSCSQHVDGPTFEDIVVQAAADVRREVRVLDVCEQPPDHPVLLNLAESRYLCGYILEMV